VIGSFQRFLNQGRAQRVPSDQAEPPLPYSWVLSHQLAIGPMPRSTSHWRQLEEAGFRNRFSCCYPHENLFSPIPEHWGSQGVSLPDHRAQEDLAVERLRKALEMAEDMVNADAPVYLHCFAGRERSVLMAVGLTARIRKLDLLAALEWVRRCHPAASPLYPHLDVLEQVLTP
jgi:hypothetical protein